MNKRFCNFILIFILSLCLVGCAGNVGLTSRGCKTSDAQIMNEEVEFKADYSWDKKVWSSGSAKLIKIRTLLAEKELDCTKVKKVRYELAQTFWDQIFSIFPFFSRMTIRVEVEKS